MQCLKTFAIQRFFSQLHSCMYIIYLEFNYVHNFYAFSSAMNHTCTTQYPMYIKNARIHIIANNKNGWNEKSNPIVCAKHVFNYEDSCILKP